MRRREVDRVPWWIGSAAPMRWWVPAVVVAAVAGGALALATGLWSLPIVLTASAPAVVELWWRRTRPPSEDAPLTGLARRLYVRRAPPERGTS